MELIALGQIVLRRWWLVLLPAVVALILTLPALGDVLNPPIAYQVAMRFSAAAPPMAEQTGVTTPYEDAVYVPLLASEFVVLNLPHWISSDSFASEVSAALAEQGVTIAPEDLRGAFSGDSFHSVMVVYVTWDDAGQIEPIAQAAVTVLQTRNQAYFPQFAANPVEVVPLDAIKVTPLAPSILTRVGPLLRIAIGLAAGLALALVAEYLDDSIRTRQDLETLGLAVLAEIPRE